MGIDVPGSAAKLRVAKVNNAIDVSNTCLILKIIIQVLLVVYDLFSADCYAEPLSTVGQRERLITAMCREETEIGKIGVANRINELLTLFGEARFAGKKWLDQSAWRTGLTSYSLLTGEEKTSKQAANVACSKYG